MRIPLDRRNKRQKDISRPELILKKWMLLSFPNDHRFPTNQCSINCSKQSDQILSRTVQRTFEVLPGGDNSVKKSKIYS